MDSGHKICFTMAVSTIYPAVSTVDGEAFIISHCHALQHKNTKYMQKLGCGDHRLAFASCEYVACTEGGLCPHVFAALISWMRVEGARILPRATTPTAANNECFSDKYENQFPAHLAQSILMAGMAAISAPSFPPWPCETFCKQLL